VTEQGATLPDRLSLGRPPSARPTIAALILGASTLALLPLWWPAHPPSTVGRPPWSERGRLDAREAAPSVHGGIATGTTIGVHSARLVDLEPVIAARPPVRLKIPGIGVAASIVPVGVHRSGVMEVPPDIGTVGWYRFGPSPGLPGSAVLVGHVDSRIRGPGVFFGLSRVAPGDVVRVRLTGGRWRAFEVVSRSLVPKNGLPSEVFARVGRPVLTMITCGGGFDWEAGRYTGNVVVAAVPRRVP
jgi:Sortase domain